MIFIQSASITSGGLGPKRTVNEDSLLVLDHEKVFAVADGVGGVQAGDLASQCAVQAIKDEVMRCNVAARAPDLISLSEAIIGAANAKVYEMAQSRRVPMASTIVLLLLDEQDGVIAHVGDSRIYLYRKGQLLQLTRDHSKLQYLLDQVPQLDIDRESYSEKNVITKALGVEKEVEPDIQKVKLKDGDIFLLCTDGVYNYHSEIEIRATLTRNATDLQSACATLKERCFEKGAKDHLTAVLIKVSVQNPDLQETVNLKAI